jgi:hypothetical protein
MLRCLKLIFPSTSVFLYLSDFWDHESIGVYWKKKLAVQLQTFLLFEMAININISKFLDIRVTFVMFGMQVMEQTIRKLYLCTKMA